MTGYEHREEDEADEDGVGEPVRRFDASGVNPRQRARRGEDGRRGNELRGRAADLGEADRKKPGRTGVWGK